MSKVTVVSTVVGIGMAVGVVIVNRLFKKAMLDQCEEMEIFDVTGKKLNEKKVITYLKKLKRSKS